MQIKKILILFFILTSLNQQTQATEVTNKVPKKISITIPKKEQGEDQNYGAIKVDSTSPKQLAANGFADIVEDLLPAVVNISALQESQFNGSGVIDQILSKESPKNYLFDDSKNQLENQLRNQQSLKKKIPSIGSGFIISRDGFVVTNSHVIEESSEIIVSLNDGEKYKAKIIGIDKKTDLALLKINVNKELKFVKFGDSTKARIGDWLIVVGNPYDLGGSVSVGIISARARDINNGQSDEFIQTDAAINQGNSGGPMFNSKGEVIGISTIIFSPSGGSVGIGFGIPSTSAIQIIKQLKEQGEVTRGWIGVAVQEVSEEMAESIKMDKAKGAFVVDLTKDGPAEKAGILPTDIILKIDDQEITEMKILPKTVAKYPINKIAKITVLRRDKIKTFNVKIAKMKDEESKKLETKLLEKKQNVKATTQLLGLNLAELNSKINNSKNIDSNLRGLLIVEVTPKSEAADKGVISGDIILSANQSPTTSIDDLKNIIEETKKSAKKLFLFVKRGSDSYAVVLTAK